jgi:class 3 adenylate cyclase/pimeloyl-ACP methyl ester carboxylesterase
VSIAYQVVGDGPVDLLWVPGWLSHLDLLWLDPGYSRFVERLTRFARVILFDKRGTGLSDPVAPEVSFDDRVEDIGAVLDAAGSRSAFVMGYSEGASLSAMFALRHPDRVRSLMLVSGFACGKQTPERPWGLPADIYDRLLEIVEHHWGEGRLAEVFAPSIADDPFTRTFVGVLERSAGSPAMARAIGDFISAIDVTALLPSLRVPTVVVQRAEEVVPRWAGEHLASLVPDARLVVLPGHDHLPWIGDQAGLLGEIEEWATGARGDVTYGDRRVLTLMFTDLVGSTSAAARGDRAWTESVARLDATTADVATRHGGRVVKTLGDGGLVVFDGPTAAVRCAAELAARVTESGLALRIGVHTGEVAVRGDDVSGVAAAVAARVCAAAGAGEVLVSSTVRDLVLGSDLTFADAGWHALKGLPDEWRLWSVTSDPSRRDATPTAASPRPMDRALLSGAKRSPRLTRAMVRVVTRRR